MAGEATLGETWGGLRLDLRPEAFLQVNRHVSEAIDRHLEARLEPGPGRRLLDLYAGVGVRAARWALAGAEVASCELGRAAAERLVAATGRLGRLAYVSCDPATLARDLRRLGRAWELEEVCTYDAFPQTAHVETVAWLRPGERRAS